MRLTRIFIGLIAVVVAMPCLGEEIIIFRSGQTIPVVSHRIVDGMVHVDLGDNAFVAFPEATIESIEIAGENVMIQQSYGIGSNVRKPTTAGDYPVSAITKTPGYEILLTEPGDENDSNIEIDKTTGMALHRPMGNHPAANKRSVAVTGDMRALGNNYVKQGNGTTTFGGTTPMGTKHVIGGLAPRRNDSPRAPNAPKPVSITLRPGIGKPAGARADSDSGRSGDRKED